MGEIAQGYARSGLPTRRQETATDAITDTHHQRHRSGGKAVGVRNTPIGGRPINVGICWRQSGQNQANRPRCICRSKPLRQQGQGTIGNSTPFSTQSEDCY